MAVEKISVKQFVDLSESSLIIDVRSPSEFQHAHYPDAISIPLFDDEERKVVGTTYKKQSREQAIKIGLDFYGPKMKNIVIEVENILKQRALKSVVVHCWRGGMRSAAIAWLLDLYGFQTYQLEGGYKAYRNWVLNQLEKPHNLVVLSGRTGSGKTALLHELQQKNYPVVDLELLAGHKGSTFGNLKHIPQGSNEFFENKLALELYKIQNSEHQHSPIWVESESSRIGDVSINNSFYNQMRNAPRIQIEIPFNERLNYILSDYGQEELSELISAVERIRRKLGGLEAQRAIDFLQENNIRSAFEILLRYYDGYYDKSTLFQPEVLNIALPTTNAQENVTILLQTIHTDGTIRV